MENKRKDNIAQILRERTHHILRDVIQEVVTYQEKVNDAHTNNLAIWLNDNVAFTDDKDLNKTAYYYFRDTTPVKDVWCVHFTNMEAWNDIKEHGFRIGTTDWTKLAYSYRQEEKGPNGWNFALPVDNKYLGDDRGYGDCGFLLRTDGVRAYHKIDRDWEIIFKGDMVKEMIPFIYDDDQQVWMCGTGEYETVKDIAKTHGALGR